MYFYFVIVMDQHFVPQLTLFIYYKMKMQDFLYIYPRGQNHQISSIERGQHQKWSFCGLRRFYLAILSWLRFVFSLVLSVQFLPFIHPSPHPDWLLVSELQPVSLDKNLSVQSSAWQQDEQTGGLGNVIGLTGCMEELGYPLRHHLQWICSQKTLLL